MSTGPERLRAWLTDNGKTGREFSEELGVQPETVSRILHRRLPVSRTVALAIECLTGGQVPRAAW